MTSCGVSSALHSTVSTAFGLHSQEHYRVTLVCPSASPSCHLQRLRAAWPTARTRGAISLGQQASQLFSR
eukprot:630337-Amphidinium_carterae.1